MRTVIIAAGQGSRLKGTTSHEPKTLLPFGNGTILSHIVLNFRAVGISEFIIVVGFQGQSIRDYVKQQDHFGCTVSFMDNGQWRRGNCLSAYEVRSLMRHDETWILSMSDHIVTPNGLQKITMETSPKNLLLVDPRLHEVYDIEDATKVHFRGRRILAIGKNLKDFNAVDCGIFRLNALFFQMAKEQISRQKETLTDTIQSLIEMDQILPVVIPEESHWIDIDTPGAYASALSREETFTQSLS